MCTLTHPDPERSCIRDLRSCSIAFRLGRVRDGDGVAISQSSNTIMNVKHTHCTIKAWSPVLIANEYVASMLRRKTQVVATVVFYNVTAIYIMPGSE